MGAALVFDPRPARLVAAGLAARAGGDRMALRVPGPLRLTTVAPPSPPGPEWVRLRPIRAGICGSDLAQVALKADMDNPLSAVVSFPHVMGHEVVAVSAEADGDGAEAVAVDPWVGCTARGVTPACASCASGHPPLCEHAGDGVGVHGRGLHLGNIAGLPGGFGAAMVAHRSALHPLPTGLPLGLGVLADPLAVGAHAVESAAVDALPGGATVLVLGAGTIGLACVTAIRDRRPDLVVLATARWPHLAERVVALGACALPAGHAAVLTAVRQRCGGTERRPWRGGPWLSGHGVAAIVDAVGSAATLDTALRVAAPRARIVTVGVGRSRRVETTLLYYKEVALSGSNGYGTGALAAAVAALDRAPERFAPWLTHTLPLSAWRAAFAAAMRPQSSGAVKVSFRLEERA